MASFDLAWRQGVDGIEFDVQLSSDGVPVVIHDARLHAHHFRQRLGVRTSGECVAPPRCGVVVQSPSSPPRARTLRRSAHSPAGGSSPMGQSAAVPGLCRNQGLPAGRSGKVLQEIERADLWHLVRVVSFDLPSLQQVRELSEQARLGLDFSGRLLPVRRALSRSARRRCCRTGRLLRGDSFAAPTARGCKSSPGRSITRCTCAARFWTAWTA